MNGQPKHKTRSCIENISDANLNPPTMIMEKAFQYLQIIY